MCCQRLVAGACNSLSLLTALPFERMLLDGTTARAMSYKSGLVGGARMKILKKAIEVSLVASAMLCTLPVHAKASKPKHLQVTYYYLPG